MPRPVNSPHEQTAKRLTKGFVIKCLHAHCSNRDRLHFLKEMLHLGWLSLSDLTDTRFLIDREPMYVPQYGSKKLNDPGFNSLSAEERGRFLYLEFGIWFFFGGSLPDDEWIMARHMGMDVSEWQALRELCIRLDLLYVEGNRLFNRCAFEEYQGAKRLYNSKVRGGRYGGVS